MTILRRVADVRSRSCEPCELEKVFRLGATYPKVIIRRRSHSSFRHIDKINHRLVQEKGGAACGIC